jgi:S-phase kinase-associated protein 1
MTSPVDKIIKIKVADGTIYNILEKYAKQSNVITQMLEDMPDSDEPIPLSENNATNKVVERVLSWMEGYYEAEDKDVYNAEYVKDYNNPAEDDTIFKIMLLANFLDIKILLDCTAKKVADIIKGCKTPEDIRQKFDIVNDFTPEEEEALKKETEWMDNL